MALEKPGVSQANIEQADDMVDAYANHVWYEASAWDLKLIFGQLDQQNGTKIVQHTSITVPWPLVKIMIFWLRGQVETHETINGPIHIPPAVMPVDLPPPTAEVTKSDRYAQLYHDVYTRLRKEFIASLNK